MDEAAGATIPKGLFKRETKGMSITPVTVRVERGRIQFFTQVLGEKDPLFTDVAAAQAMGHPDIAAPPTFFVAIEADAADERRRRGEPDALALAGCDFRYLLHGEELYTYEGLIFAGDEVSISTTIVDFYDRKGGAMEFVVLESVITHATRGPLVRRKRTLLHRLG